MYIDTYNIYTQENSLKEQVLLVGSQDETDWILEANIAEISVSVIMHSTILTIM